MAAHAQITAGRPIPGVLFGITHQTDGSLIIREPRILKVGIGLPRGPAANVWIAPGGQWKVRIGFKNDTAKTYTFTNRQQAEAFYRENVTKAPVCNYPRKIGFFTFTRPALQSDGTELFEPDWEAIEAHGPTPTEIDIVFLDDDPFTGAYQMWSTSELKCKGDGMNALRVVTLATAEQKEAAEMASANGEKYFSLEGCWTGGCPYAKEPAPNKPSPCKPGGDLKFQLARNIRVGGTAYFHTSGYRSISQIFSSLYRLKTLTGGHLAGIPLKMVLRPYKTVHNGQAATQYGISLEFRAEDVESLRRNLIEQALNFRQLAQPEPRPAVRMLEAGTEEAGIEPDEEPPIGAAAMAAEFYPEGGFDEGAEPAAERDAPKATTPAASAPAAAATEQKTTALADKLRQSKARAKTTATAKAEQPAVAAVPQENPAGQGNEVVGDMF